MSGSACVCKRARMCEWGRCVKCLISMFEKPMNISEDSSSVWTCFTANNATACKNVMFKWNFFCFRRQISSIRGLLSKLQRSSSKTCTRSIPTLLWIWPLHCLFEHWLPWKHLSNIVLIAFEWKHRKAQASPTKSKMFVSLREDSKSFFGASLHEVCRTCLGQADENCVSIHEVPDWSGVGGEQIKAILEELTKSKAS